MHENNVLLLTLGHVKMSSAEKELGTQDAYPNVTQEQY